MSKCIIRSYVWICFNFQKKTTATKPINIIISEEVGITEQCKYFGVQILLHVQQDAGDLLPACAIDSGLL